MKIILFIIIAVVSVYECCAQKEHYNWYFGDNAAVTFLPSGEKPVVLGNSMMDAEAGSASISDSAGNLLFYTDGRHVWNRNHEIMPNGNIIKSSINLIKNQLIVQNPEMKNIYYLFKIKPWVKVDDRFFSYSVVNMNLNNGLGDVIQKNIVLYENPSINLAGVSNLYSSGYWVVIHENYSNIFLSYEVTEDGVDPEPVISAVGSYHRAGGQMKFSKDGSKLAKLNGNYNYDRPGLIEIFDFDRETGKVSNPISVDLYELYGINGAYHGLEFSPDASKLYVTIPRVYNPDTTILVQLSFKKMNGRDTITKIHIDSITEGEIWRLLLGPDNKIYGPLLTNYDLTSNVYLSVINEPNFEYPDCGLGLKGVRLIADTTEPGFLEFVVNVPPCLIDLHCWAAADTICEGDTAIIMAVPDAPGSFSYEWAGGEETKEIYVSKGGIYKVYMRNEKGCIDSAEIEITALPIPAAEIEAPGGAALCPGGELVLRAKSPLNEKYNYWWNTGVTGPEIIVNSPGKYKLFVANELGCADSSEIEIRLLSGVSAEIELEGDSIICPGESLRLLAIPYNDNYTYSWNTGEKASSITIADSGRYQVYITNEQGCSDTAEIYIGMHPEINAEISYSGDTNLCSSETLELTALPSGQGYSYLWGGGETTQSITISDSGLYKAVITGPGGCSDSAEIRVRKSPEYDAMIISSGITNLCEQDSIDLKASADIPGQYVYIWSNGDTSQAISANIPGLYKVLITNQYGCSDSAEIEITKTPDFRAEINSGGISKICLGDSVKLKAEPDGEDYSYKWGGGETTPEIIAKGPGDYEVIVTNQQGCPDTAVLNIGAYPPVIPSIYSYGPDDACDGDTIMLTAVHSPGSGYTYKWNTGDTSKSIYITKPRAYFVTVTSPNGCRGWAMINLYMNPQIALRIDTVFASIGEPDATIVIYAKTLTGKHVNAKNVTLEIIIPGEAFSLLENQPEAVNSYIDGAGNLHIFLEKPAFGITEEYRPIFTINGEALLGRSYEYIIHARGLHAENIGLCTDSIIKGVFITDTICAHNIRRVGGFIPAEMSIAPNPASNTAEFVIKYQASGPYKFQLVAAGGEEAAKTEWANPDYIIKEKDIRIDLSGIANGVYFAVLKTPGAPIVKKFVIIK